MNTENVHIGRASAKDLMAYSLLQMTLNREEAAAVLNRMSSNYEGLSREASVKEAASDGFTATVYRTSPADNGRVEVSELHITVSPKTGKTVAGIVVSSDPRLLGRDAAMYARQCCEDLLRELRGGN